MCTDIPKEKNIDSREVTEKTSVNLTELKKVVFDTLFLTVEKKLNHTLKKCKREKCRSTKKVCKGHGYCEECEGKFIHMIRIISLVNDDTNTFMTMHMFADLFEKVLFPLFEQTHFDRFIGHANSAYEDWL